MSASPTTPTPKATPHTRAQGPPIELGWVLAGAFSAEDRAAVEQARRRFLALMRDTFPEFDWVMPVVQRRELIAQHPVAPVTLLEAGAVEREAARWDYAFVVTEADLRGYYKPALLGAPCQALSTAVLSTARLDPAAYGVEADGSARTEAMARRLVALAVHQLGHLNHMPHSDDPTCWMFDLESARDLDRMTRLTVDGIDRLGVLLARVSDTRLEETGRYTNPLRLVAGVLWFQRREVFSAVVEIEPWRFPLRLTKLTTAALSATLLLINTAETWDLGLNQSPKTVFWMSALTITGTAWLLLKRQRLIVGLSTQAHPLSEQRVISATAMALGVWLGMVTTYALTFVGVVLIDWALFSPELIRGWAATLHQPPTWRHDLIFAGFVASLGLIVGSVGAAFESEDYIRHVAFVDEET